jgi:hypothetical protein
VFADTTPQSTRTEVIDTVINAKSVKRVAPKYPTNAAKKWAGRLGTT